MNEDVPVSDPAEWYTAGISLAHWRKVQAAAAEVHNDALVWRQRKIPGGRTYHDAVAHSTALHDKLMRLILHTNAQDMLKGDDDASDIQREADQT